MRSTSSLVVGIAGLSLALLSCVVVMKTAVVGVITAQQVMEISDGGVPELSVVIGETIVAVFSRGLFAVLPALLIYIALVPLRFRERWFYRGVYATSIYLILVPPSASIFGIMLLIAL